MIKSLFIQHYPALVYFASKMLHGNRQDGEDTVMAVFYKLCKHWEKYKAYPDKKSLLYIWTKRECFSALKAKKPMSRTPDFLDIEQQITDTNTLNYIYKLLPKVPEMQRKVFELSYLKQFTSEEICRELNITHGAARAHKSRAIRRLRQIVA